MTNDEMRKQFYDKVSEILDIEHEYVTPVPRRTRWNNRIRGNGRYPGFGTVQHFGAFIRIISRHGTVMCDTEDEVYEYLGDMMER